MFEFFCTFPNMILKTNQQIMYSKCILSLMTCCYLLLYVLSFIFWIEYETNSAMFNRVCYIFVPIWIVWGTMLCAILTCCMNDINKYDIEFLNHEYGQHIRLSSINDATLLNQLNEQMIIKRNHELFDSNNIRKEVRIFETDNNQDNDESIIISDKGRLTAEKVYCRLRSKNLIEEIISPNHVCLDKKDVHHALPYAKK